MLGHPLCGVIYGENQQHQQALRVTYVSKFYSGLMDKLEVCADVGEILIIHPHIFKRDQLASGHRTTHRYLSVGGCSA